MNKRSGIGQQGNGWDIYMLIQEEAKATTLVLGYVNEWRLRPKGLTAQMISSQL